MYEGNNPIFDEGTRTEGFLKDVLPWCSNDICTFVRRNPYITGQIFKKWIYIFDIITIGVQTDAIDARNQPANNSPKITFLMWQRISQLI